MDQFFPLTFSRMLHNSADLTTFGCNYNNNNNNTNRENNINNSNNAQNISMGYQRPIFDLLVALVAVPIMIVCALQLEKNLQDMANNPESRWVVFALGISMLVISIVICGYITHRMGVCMWAGPIDQLGNRVDGHNILHINSQNDILRIVDTMPPSYESVMNFDIPPPAYDCLVINMEDCKENGSDSTASSISTANSSARSSLALIGIHNNHSTTTTISNNNNNNSNTNNSRTGHTNRYIYLGGKLLPVEDAAMHI